MMNTICFHVANHIIKTRIPPSGRSVKYNTAPCDAVFWLGAEDEDPALTVAQGQRRNCTAFHIQSWPYLSRFTRNCQESCKREESAVNNFSKSGMYPNNRPYISSANSSLYVWTVKFLSSIMESHF